MSLKICYIKYNVLLDLNCIATITTTIIVNSTTAPLGTVIFLHPYTMLSPGDKGLVQQQNTHFYYNTLDKINYPEKKTSPIVILIIKA